VNLLNNLVSKSAISALAVGAALAFAPMNAEAATIAMNNNGSTLGIDAGPVVKFKSSADDTGLGGAGSWQYTFGLLVGGTGFGAANISFNNYEDFVDPMIAWLDSDSNVIASTPVTDSVQGTTISGYAELGTVFSNPDSLTQTFQLSWADGTVENSGFDVSVNINPVPLPAGGLLLLTALGGVAALRRKRKAA